MSKAHDALAARRRRVVFWAVLGHRLIVVSDAHLGAAPPAVEEALLAFLDAVPSLGDCLLLNGDIFDFWFAYSRVVPRRGFRVTAAIAALARRMPIAMVGGNHDRWGSDFWGSELGIRFARREVRFRVGERQVLAMHGDGLAEHSWRQRLLQGAVGHPVTSAVYRALHPELGVRLVERMTALLAARAAVATRSVPSAAQQLAWATKRLAREPELGLLVMGHSHAAAVIEVRPGGQYLNPGAWLDGFRYAVASEDAAELCRFS